MTILIVGKSGQVARALAERAENTSRLVALGRPDLDITRPATIRSAIERTNAAIVINASAYTAVDRAEDEEADAFAVNADGPQHLAAACKAAGIPLIHFSTDYVFDGTKYGAYKESDPTAPLSVYGRSKLAGEQAVAATLDDHVILRTAWVYSPFGTNFVKTMLRLASSRDELGVVADQAGCPTSALDIADAALAIAHQILNGGARFGVFHLTGSGETSWHGLAAEVFSLSASLGGPTATARPIATTDYPTPAARPANSMLDGSKLAELYGIRLPDWRASVRTCVERLLQEGTFA
ncbi:MAG: dTDP-4-dehydrorhamnose reductase [Henriciella sp.]|uniref:dTDP-4-dehydrorhamnose reductase n=1 Tax=Henriciella sp. TaxID=1968823 RepID=UPI003C763A3B